MKRLFDFNVKMWRIIKENKILSLALIIFITFSIINSLLVYNFVQVLQNL